MKQKELEFDFFKYKISYKKKVKNYFSSFLFSSVIFASYLSIAFSIFGHLLFIHHQSNNDYTNYQSHFFQKETIDVNALRNTKINFSPISKADITFISPYLNNK